MAQSQVLNVPIPPNLTPAISVNKHDWFELLLANDAEAQTPFQ